MNYWNQFPLFRLILPFISGIIVALSFDSEIHIPLTIFITLIIVITIYVFFIANSVRYRFRWILGIVIYTAIFLFGFELTILNTEKYHPSHFGNLLKKEYLFVARVTEPIVEKEKTNKAIVEVLSIKGDSAWINTEGKAIIYLQKDSLSSCIKYGDCLLINTWINEVKPPQNPEEFNYKRYLSNRNIYHQAYIKSGKWKTLSHDNGNKLFAFAFSLRNKFLQIFKENGIVGKEFAVASALILGYRDKLDADLIREYSGAGAMHILCVSGLHVGIIYLILSSLLFFMNRSRYSRISKSIILILLIWFYALLTGLSPSVLRASTMISFIIIGGLLNRYTNIYNTLAASAFLLLIINPFIITEVGFQLSYLAVIGIVLLQPKIYNLWIPDNWILDKLWAITAVSIAAQLFTFPLALFYFHQFPNYFLITNLIVIPLSGFIIYAGILVLLFSAVSWLSGLFANILVLMLKGLNTSVSFIEGLPYSTTHGVSITMIETLLFYSIITGLIVFILLNKRRAFIYAIGLAIILAVSFSIKNYKRINQRKFIVYNINKTSAYDFIDGKQNFLLSDSLLLNDEKKQQFHLQNNWDRSGLNNTTTLDLTSSDSHEFQNHFIYKRNNFIQFGNKRIAILNRKNSYLKNTGKIRVDYLIIAGNIKLNIADILRRYDAKQIIIDSSNWYWKTNKWLDECKALHIECHSVLHEGAFVVDV